MQVKGCDIRASCLRSVFFVTISQSFPLEKAFPVEDLTGWRLLSFA